MKLEIERQHLNRYVSCRQCKLLTTAGKLIAKDVLRCPRCDSDDIMYPMRFCGESGDIH